MTKPNKDGWIRHRGGKCPVANGTLVDVRYRCGEFNYGVPALKLGDAEKVDASYAFWQHASPNPYDILAYRLHQPKMTAEQIRTKFIENLAAIAALHKEQAALVQQLRELGFVFVDATSESEEDMSDYRNWKRGDLLEVIKANGRVPVGAVVQHDDEDGDETPYTKSAHHERWSIDVASLKFHSRPTKK